MGSCTHIRPSGHEMMKLGWGGGKEASLVWRSPLRTTSLGLALKQALVLHNIRQVGLKETLQRNATLSSSGVLVPPRG